MTCRADAFRGLRSWQEGYITEYEGVDGATLPTRQEVFRMIAMLNEFIEKYGLDVPEDAKRTDLVKVVMEFVGQAEDVVTEE
jgi:hypothetical protein